MEAKLGPNQGLERAKQTVILNNNRNPQPHAKTTVKVPCLEAILFVTVLSARTCSASKDICGCYCTEEWINY